jgi:hypothetical protein
MVFLEALALLGLDVGISSSGSSASATALSGVGKMSSLSYYLSVSFRS